MSFIMAKRSQERLNELQHGQKEQYNIPMKEIPLKGVPAMLVELYETNSTNSYHHASYPKEGSFPIFFFQSFLRCN